MYLKHKTYNTIFQSHMSGLKSRIFILDFPPNLFEFLKTCRYNEKKCTLKTDKRIKFFKEIQKNILKRSFENATLPGNPVFSYCMNHSTGRILLFG